MDSGHVVTLSLVACLVKRNFPSYITACTNSKQRQNSALSRAGGLHHQPTEGGLAGALSAKNGSSMLGWLQVEKNEMDELSICRH